MPLWRIRIRLSDDPHSRAQLDQALAGQRVRDVSFAPRTADPADPADMTSDVVLELPRDDDLGLMLSALHQISPQVFVSRVDGDRAAGTRRTLTIPFRHGSELAASAASLTVATAE